MIKAPKRIKELIERFERNLPAYKSQGYKEDQLRQEFINPFFEALGWDVYNKAGAAPAYRDVIYEDSIKMAKGTKAPDYCFTLSGRRMFFVEAKKPFIDIKKDIHPAYQLRRYAWSAKLPLSILTDFEEFAVYESRKRPKKDDKSSTERIMYLTYKDYIKKWDEIYNIFSKEAIIQGSFDRFIESAKKKRGTAEVDDEFLKEIEGWREELARNIALRNPDLSVRELNYAVQRTIDRILFLRMCEDRGVEPYGQLLSLFEEDNIYGALCKIYVKADEKYNSGIFHFKKEKGRATLPDWITLDLTIDDKVLKRIIKHLYYPDCPYEFSVLSPEILGNVYEQFLGKVIRLTPNHRAKVEEKPEVKKAGGVYYTPKYIVDYIVKNTVGKLCKGKSSRQISKLRILDPACGSGSFLLGAYTYILNYHLDYYSKLKNPKQYKDEIHQGKNGDWYLTIKEKKRILLNNIYGVDIDEQAVEVTKLSLLLKVLEGESKDVLEKQQKLWRERALPDLGNNIKCGNSLVGPDFYSGGTQTTLFDEDEMYRINVFNWDKEFKEIMDNGGFDALIGNPPYLRIQGLQEYYKEQIDYFSNKYESAVKRFDLYLLFIERGYSLLNKNGLLSYICPHKFLNSDFGSGLREFLVQNKAIKEIISFGQNQVFESASVYTGIFILQKSKKNSFNYYEFEEDSNLPQALENLKRKTLAKYDFRGFSEEPWVLLNKDEKTIFKKISKQPDTLGTVFEEIVVGIQSGIDEIHVLKAIENKGELMRLYSEKDKIGLALESGILKPFLKGEDVNRYEAPFYSHYCIYPYKIVNGKTKIVEEKELMEEFPLAYRYLERHRKELKEKRIKQKTNPKYWYSCHRSRDMSVFEKKRIITPEISYKGNMTMCGGGKYNNTQVYSLVPFENREERLEYWLGILNSNLAWWFIKETGTVLRGGYFRFKTNYLKPFPVRTIDFSVPEDKGHHDKMVKLVERMLNLHKKLADVKTPIEKERLQRQIDAIDQQINSLVYELYGLTEEEIKIVEGAK